MKKYLIIATLFLGACASFVGKTNYVPLGPQDLSRSVHGQDVKSMPVYADPDQLPPYVDIAFYQDQRIPKDTKVIKREIEKIKELAAKKGADAIILKQFYNDDDPSYPINLGCRFVKYLETMTPEDNEKAREFANLNGAM